jgi:hypothetical protein
MADVITIPTQLRNPHPLLERTRRAYESAKPDTDGRIRPRPSEGVVRLIVSRAALRRSLLLLEGIFREAEKRGWEAKPVKGSFEPAGVAIVAGGHSYNISIHELHDRVPTDDAYRERWLKQNEWKVRFDPDLQPPNLQSVPNGRLKLLLPSVWNGARSSWSEGPRGPLERKLPGFFAEIERRIEDDDHRAEERAREREFLRERELARLEQQRLAQREKEREAQLVGELTRWRLADDVRAYAEALRGETEALDDDDRTRVLTWCSWINGWADRADPARHLETVGRLDDGTDVVPDHPNGSSS